MILIITLNLPINGLNIITNKPLNTMNIPKALGNLLKEQYSDTVRFKLTKVAPRKNPIITNVTIKNVPFDCATMTGNDQNENIRRNQERINKRWFLANVLDRPIPTSMENVQNTILFFNLNLSNIVGSVSRARMSVNAVIDKQEAISALLIPIDHQVPSKGSKKF